jgi:Tfp pilus assembly protein PilN
MRTLNLASRPFRNERLPNVLAVVALLGVLTASAWHLFVARDVLPDRTSSLIHALGEREAESAALRTEEAGLRALRPEEAALAEWQRVKDLVDKRVFSWSGLFSVLEETLPDGVRLKALEPQVKDQGLSLSMQATARTHEEAMEMMARLEERPEFEGVAPSNRSTNEDGSIQISCSVARYKPQPPVPAAPTSPSPAPAQTPVADPPSVPSTQAMR